MKTRAIKMGESWRVVLESDSDGVEVGEITRDYDKDIITSKKYAYYEVHFGQEYLGTELSLKEAKGLVDNNVLEILKGLE
jgi:hypothetical protein